ncbi:FAD-dependent monooxygenase boa8 [Clarireedia jacksonii]
MSSKHQMKVVIVGGSIAGLTLAHCLSRYGIDYVVLERRNDIAPQVGASVSLQPNGARILDQLGMFDEVSENIVPCIFMQTWTAEGRLLSETDSPILTEKRLGYTITFLERERLLKILYQHLPDKSKVLTGKCVKSIVNGEEEGVVLCKDGSRYTGDVIAGADGIHSIIRAEMRKQIAKEGAVEDIEALKLDEAALSAEYSCLFGISKPTRGLKIGHTHRSCGKDFSTLVFGGADGKVYWFLFAKFGERKFGADIPRYKKGDETIHVVKYVNSHVSGDVLFGEVWDNRIVANFVAVEEMENKKWVWNRVACLGDSIHKMTPNLGQGANCAIESATELANSLATVLKPDGRKPTSKDITKALLSYHENRHVRANLIVKAANKFTRVEALATTGDWLASMFIIPRLGDILADRGAKVQVGATKLDCLPMPKRALEGTMPWNSNSGIGKEESKKRRAQIALPLLLLGLICYWNREPISDLFLPGTFLAETKSEILISMVNVLPLVGIWTIESYRRGNALTIANIMPTLILLMAQKYGIGLVAPIYFFFHYVQSPQENFNALDNRLTNMSFVKAFPLAIFLIIMTPAYAIYTAKEIEPVKWVYDNVWYWYPIYLTLFLKLSKIIVKDTTRTARIHEPTADLLYLRATYAILIISCGLFQLFATESHLATISALLQKWWYSNNSAHDVRGLIAVLLRSETVYAYGAASFWALLHFSDLKYNKKLSASWFTILGVLVISTVVAGPRVALLILWAWREEVMARKLVMSQ